MASTRITHYTNAPRALVYESLLDPLAVAKWKVPDGMTCHVHDFDGREGGSFRISLTYEASNARGKTGERTDTYRGRFVKLVPNEHVVEVDEFETDDPALRVEMTITITLRDVENGTEVIAVTMACRLASRPPTTTPAGGWRSPGSRRWSRSMVAQGDERIPQINLQFT